MHNIVMLRCDFRPKLIYRNGRFHRFPDKLNHLFKLRRVCYPANTFSNKLLHFCNAHNN